MNKFLPAVLLIAALFSACNIFDTAGPDYLAEGWERSAQGDYSKTYEYVNIQMVGGIRYSLAGSLEKGFYIGHNAEKELRLNVESIVLESASGKKYDGKVTSTVFNENSEFGYRNRGYIRVRWEFGEPDIEALGDNFDVVFNLKLNGRPETVTAHFEMPAAYLDPGKKNP